MIYVYIYREREHIMFTKKLTPYVIKKKLSNTLVKFIRKKCHNL